MATFLSPDIWQPSLDDWSPVGGWLAVYCLEAGIMEAGTRQEPVRGRRCHLICKDPPDGTNGSQGASGPLGRLGGAALRLLVLPATQVWRKRTIEKGARARVGVWGCATIDCNG